MRYTSWTVDALSFISIMIRKNDKEKTSLLAKLSFKVHNWLFKVSEKLKLIKSNDILIYIVKLNHFCLT